MEGGVSVSVSMCVCADAIKCRAFQSHRNTQLETASKRIENECKQTPRVNSSSFDVEKLNIDNYSNICIIDFILFDTCRATLCEMCDSFLSSSSAFALFNTSKPNNFHK